MGVPTDVAGLRAWWKADAITGVSNGAGIASWPDSGLNGYTAAQASSGNQPTYQTGVINGKPVTRWTGVNYMTSTAPTITTAGTLFAVVSSSADQTIMGGDGGSGSGCMQWEIGAGQQLVLSQGVAVQGTSNTALSAFSVVSFSYTDPVGGSGGALAFYLNGTADGTAAPTTSINATPSNAWLGARDGGAFFTGDIAEIIVYDTVLSAANRALVHTYLSDKYGIAVSDYISSPAPLFTPPPGRLAPAGRWWPFVGDPTAAGATSASAENAAGTAAAYDATPSVAPAAGNAAGTGTAGASTPSIAPNAGNAAGTAAAYGPTPSVAPAAGNAAGTGTAYSATVTGASNTTTEAATGTGAAGAPAPNVAPTAGNAAGTGTAYAASTTISSNVPAGNAAGAGAAYAATPNVGPRPAAAAGTGTAYDATVSVATAAGNAAGTGSAGAPTPSVAPSAGNATGSGTAYDATVSTSASGSANAGNAAGTGTAYGPTPSVAPAAGNAAGTGTAYDATVSTAGTGSATAGNASGTGSAYAPAAAIAPTAGNASGTGTAYAPTPSVAPAAGNAAGTGQANTPAPSVTVNAGHASGTGTAYDATVSGVSAGSGNAGSAPGTGTAYDATPKVSAHAGHAAGSGNAWTPTITITRGDAGSWYGLLSILRAARAPQPVRTDCPNDGAQLVDGHCPFDGYQAPGGARQTKPGGDWGGLQTILADARTPVPQLPADPPGWGPSE